MVRIYIVQGKAEGRRVACGPFKYVLKVARFFDLHIPAQSEETCANGDEENENL